MQSGRCSTRTQLVEGSQGIQYIISEDFVEFYSSAEYLLGYIGRCVLVSCPQRVRVEPCYSRRREWSLHSEHIDWAAGRRGGGGYIKIRRLVISSFTSYKRYLH